MLQNARKLAGEKGAKSLHFNDYDFQGEVEDFYQWVINGADYNVWNLESLKEDMRFYLKYARIAYEEMLNTILPNSDYVVDGSMQLHEIIEQIMNIIKINY